MKITTAIALTAFLGNAAFSNGALDVCNRGNETVSNVDKYDANEFGCQKTCTNPTSGISNQVKIFCQIAKSELGIEGDGDVDCFDPAVTAGGCKDVDVHIIYKYHNNNNIPLDLIHGDMDSPKPTSWMAFDGAQVLRVDSGVTKHRLQPNSSQNKDHFIRYRKKDSDGPIPLGTINTCKEILVEMKSKVKVPDDTQNTDTARDWSTNACGISGKILLCDDECQKTAEPTNSPTASPTSSPTASPTAGPTASPTAAPTIAPTPAPRPTDPDQSNPSPSSPTKGSAGKKTKTPTIAKGKKGTEPATRKLKNRKVVRV